MISIFKDSIYSLSIMKVFFRYINWDLDPEIIKLFNFISIRYYSIFFAIGLFLGFLVVKFILKREHIPSQILDGLAMCIVIGSIIGARLGHCLFYEPKYYFNHLTEIFLPIKIYSNGDWEYSGFQGLASHGGALGVLTAIYI